MNASAGAGAGGGVDRLGASLGNALQGPGLRWALACLALMVVWRVLRRVVPAIGARYDKRVQRAPEPAATDQVLALLQSPAAGQLLAWCFAGAGSGAAPLWRPGQRPAVGQRLALALLNGPSPADAPAALALALALHLDGSQQLHAAGGRWARWRLRLRVKFNDACWWRCRLPSDPWDAGHLLNQSNTPAQLALWRPRRASLLLVDGLPLAQTLAAVQALAAQQAAYDHPVRLLLVGLSDPQSVAALQAAAALAGVPLTRLPTA